MKYAIDKQKKIVIDKSFDMPSKVFSFGGILSYSNFYNIIRRPIVVEFMDKLFSGNAFMDNFT